MQLNGQPEVFDWYDEWEVEEEVVPVGFPIVVENEDKLKELDEEGVEDPEEGEVSPVRVVVVEEVEDESMNIGVDVIKHSSYLSVPPVTACV